MPPLHILIVDEHDVYRAACAALLRTEGLDVSEAAPGGDVIGLARALEPNVVLVDAALPAVWLRETAQLLRSLPSAPAVVLISTAGRERLDPCLAELPFLAKADVCARELFRALLPGSDKPAPQLESKCAKCLRGAP
jgi:CheY-like chemotaxis protein